MEEDIELRMKIAGICKSIPEYELSIDLIVKEFRVKGWDFVLEPITPITYRATSRYWGVDVEDTCAARALCVLFLEVHERVDE